jgi:hypothetical protein
LFVGAPQQQVAKKSPADAGRILGPNRPAWVSNQTSVHTLGGLVVVVLQTVLVAHHLPIQFVHQLIDSGIKVFM